MKKVLLTVLFSVVSVILRRIGEDVRLVHDDPPGTLSFQGQFRYWKRFKL